MLGLAATEFAVRHVTLRLKDPDLSDVAERALVLAGDAALPALVEWLGSAVPSDRRAALQVALGALGQGGSVPSPWLVSVRASVADDDPETAALAVRVLSRVGDEGDIAHVASVATHASWSVSSASTAALATLAARFPGAALAYVRRGATDGAPVPVLLALAGVLHGTPHAYDGTRALAERGFASDDPRVRRMAVLTLADAYGKEATESIAFALADEDSSVRVAAVRALGVLGEAVRLDALVAAGSDPALVGPALVALLTTDRRLAEARMLSLVRSADPVLASIAVEVSARALPSVRVEVLRVALAHATTDVVIGALAEIDSELVAALVEPLARLSADPKPEVRSLVASVFGSSSFEGARAHLVACHGRETDPIVRTVLEDALASVAGADGRDASGSAVP
ncbi:MAG: HEAT repeat domain-containing protein [Polyangiaceae bacterium]